MSLELQTFDGTFGFLPNSPLLKLSDPLYKPWEDIVADLNQLIVSSTIRSRVNNMPILSIESLGTEKELCRAHLLLSLIAHSYIVGFPCIDKIESFLPAQIAVPWYAISCLLGLKPVVSYASLELHNFKILNPDLPPSLHNLGMIHTFSGSFDESWFYLIPLAIELAGAPAVKAILNALLDFENGEMARISDYLKVIKDHISEMTKILKLMYNRNDPHIFWHRVRPYSGGSKNNALLPNGIFYEGVTRIDEYCSEEYEIPPGKVGTWRKYAGASAGQSPLIHTLDVGLSIKHQNLPSTDFNPMLEMRDYLSQKHRDFLSSLSKRKSLSHHIILSKNTEWMQNYNLIIEELKYFRDVHIQLTTLYIIQQSIKDKNASPTKESFVGTGGTDLVKFLKQSRNETIQAKIQND